jgi:hypothetical protein
MKSGFRITILVFLTLLSPACSEQACYDDTDPLVNVILLESGTGAAKNSVSLKITGLTGVSPVDLVTATSVAKFSFPLNPAEETSVIVIVLNDIADTATISYTNFVHLVSPECGYTFYSVVQGLNTTHNIIDSLIIENKNITVDGERNMRLFY